MASGYLLYHTADKTFPSSQKILWGKAALDNLHDPKREKGGFKVQDSQTSLC